MIKINKDHLKFIFLCLFLCIITLSIPKISLGFLLITPFVLNILGYLKINKYILYSNLISFSIASLIFFTIYNYSVIYLYNLVGNIVLVQALTILILYLSGISLNFSKMPFFPLNFVFINLAVFTGGIIHVFLSVGKSTQWTLSIERLIIPSREVPSFWSTNILDSVNGPSLDMFSYLGLCLIGVIVGGFILENKNIKKNFLIFVLLLLLVMMSIYSSIGLGARTPIIVFVLSIFVSFVFVNFTKYPKTLKDIFVLMFYILFSIIIFLFGNKLLTEFSNSLITMGIGTRLASQGLESSRYDIWFYGINQFLDFPWGGREASIPEGELFFHNIWLDQWYDAGLPAIFFLLIFHLAQIPIIITFLRLKVPRIVHLFVICILIGFMSAFLQAPVIQASNIYFGISCFFFGTLSKFVYDVKYFIQKKTIFLTLQ